MNSDDAMADTSVSLIPVPAKRNSVQSIRSSVGPGSPGKYGHRRRTSALSARSHTSGDEASIRTPLSVTSGSRQGHRRTQDSISDAGSPLVDMGPFSGAFDHYGSEYDADSKEMDPRAMALSTLSKQPQRPRVSTASSVGAYPQRSSRSSASGDVRDVRRSVTTPGSLPVTPMSAIPLSLQEGSSMSRADKRMSLSRIPRSTVTHAVSQYHAMSSRGAAVSPTLSDSAEYMESNTSMEAQSPSSSMQQRRASGGIFTPSPKPPTAAFPTRRHPSGSGLRQSLGGSIGPASAGKSSKIISALQTELEHTKAVLEQAQSQVRSAHREIGTLTARSEDLRETRDRMRAEADALNNVISRKERMVTEVLTRARTAESTSQQLQAERAAYEIRIKAIEAQARAEVEEAFIARVKAESESSALRDSVRSLRLVWGREVDAYRNEVTRMAAHVRAEREMAILKRDEVMVLVKKQTADHANVLQLIDDVNAKHAAVTTTFEEEARALRADVDRHASDADKSRAIARALALELTRLRHLARQHDRPDLDAAAKRLADMGADLDALVLGDGGWEESGGEGEGEGEGGVVHAGDVPGGE